jgi:hypothetical protein
MKHVIVVVGLALMVGVAVLLAAHGVAQVAPGGGGLCFVPQRCHR